MKKVIGHFIFISLGVLAFNAYVAKYGLRDTLIIFAVSLGLVGLTLLAVWLIVSE